MKIKINEIPEGKTTKDYPPDTEFIIDDSVEKYTPKSQDKKRKE